MMKPKLSVIAFDADDTLWVNEPYYRQAEEKIEQIILSYVNLPNIKQAIYATEMKNLQIFGYGSKGFTISMIETAIELTNAQITANDIQKIIDEGKGLMQHLLELLPNVETALQQLKKFKLMLITKGDLFDQEVKIARSGLADYFDYIEIVSEKDAETYRRTLEKYNVPVDEFLMIGNSARSDVLPVLEIGGHAVHIPFHTTWEHETVDENQGYDFPVLASIEQVGDYIQSNFI